MIHNDVLRSVRYMLDISDKKVIEIGDPHTVAWATITQDRFDTRAQQTSDRRVQFILGKLGERITHACLPFLSVPSFLSIA